MKIVIIMLILGIIVSILEKILEVLDFTFEAIGGLGEGIVNLIKKVFKTMEDKPGISFLIIWGGFSIILYGDFNIFVRGEILFLLIYLGIFVIKYAIRMYKVKTVKVWMNEAENLNIDVDYTFASIVDQLEHKRAYYDYRNMPYGRAKSFIREFGNIYLDDEYYFFEPIRTKNVYDIRENGLLIAKSGIYMSCEETDSSGKQQVVRKCLEFSKLYRFDNVNGKCIMLNNTRDDFYTLDWTIFGFEKVHRGLEKIVQKVCQNKLPQIINYYGVQGNIEEVGELNITPSLDMSTIGMWAGNESRIQGYDEQKKYMSGNQGHGYAAEYGNLVVDKLLGKDVINEAQNLDPLTNRQRKDGADRIVNGVPIQTKYYKDFNNLYKEIFPGGKIRYIIDGKAMPIEVPRDKYIEYCDKLQRKIDNGEINSIKRGTPANKILRKGSVTYAQAQNIARAGTIESLTVDFSNGAIQSANVATISAVITFARAIWAGKNVDEAVRISMETGIRTVGKNAVINTISMQLSRERINPLGILGEDFINPLYKTTDATAINNTLTMALTFGPDICKFFQGRISEKQLFKNSAIAVGGIAGGMATGGVVAGPLGMFIGSILGSMATKAILDEFVEDDAIEMFYIYKEEYIECITEAVLDEKELYQVAENTLNSQDLSEILEVMYSVVDSRECARRQIQDQIQNIYEKRQIIRKEYMENAYIKYLT